MAGPYESGRTLPVSINGTNVSVSYVAALYEVREV
jgi:hypothetical protein